MEQTTVLNKLSDKNQNALQMETTGFSTSAMNEDGEELEEEEENEEQNDEEVELDENVQDMEEDEAQENENQDEDEDEEDPIPIQPVLFSRNKKEVVNLEDPDNPQFGKKKKLDAKKRKKEIKKQKKRSLQQVDEQEDYDFSTHFGKQEEEDDDIDISEI